MRIFHIMRPKTAHIFEKIRIFYLHLRLLNGCICENWPIYAYAAVFSRICGYFAYATVLANLNVFSRICGRILVAYATFFADATFTKSHIRPFIAYSFRVLAYMRDAAVFFFNLHMTSFSLEGQKNSFVLIEVFKLFLACDVVSTKIDAIGQHQGPWSIWQIKLDGNAMNV